MIIAAAGPLWNPPVAATSRSAPLLILLDDGWRPASSWDARLRTADELIGRAEADGRGVAVLPLSETTRDISMRPERGARRGQDSSSRSRMRVERSEALPVHRRASCRTRPTSN